MSEEERERWESIEPRLRPGLEADRADILMHICDVYESKPDVFEGRYR